MEPFGFCEAYVQEMGVDAGLCIVYLFVLTPGGTAKLLLFVLLIR